MNRYLAILLWLAFGISAPALGGNEAVTTLKADLESVVELGRVEPVSGLTTAGQPDEAAFRVFAENGYHTVIDLRTAEEDRGLDEPAVVDQLGMRYIAMPIGAGDINFDKARELAELLDRSEGPILLHCASANRVGALLALNVYEETGDAALALQTGRAAGMTRLEKLVTEIIDAD